MHQPVIYYQTDPRWKYNDYSARGESTTIGASGCGPTAMSMVLATWADSRFTPASECAWALKNGYKAPHQGTYYAYFKPAAARYGLSCRMINGVSIYGNTSSAYHEQARKHILNGGLVIACMGKGLWTSSGHFVLCYDIRGNVIYINDPASSKPARTAGDYSVFKKQVKFYFLIDNPHKDIKEESKGDELDLTIDELIEKLTDEQAAKIVNKAQHHLRTLPEPDWSVKEGSWEAAEKHGITDGTNPCDFVTRCQAAAMIERGLEEVKDDG